ncbi:MAG: thioesterase family protein [Myxococcales bacterium]|jgi:fluoroacetyl-CoA thioesterase
MLTAGQTREETRIVTEEDSAARISPLVPPVYASARMIGFAESVCAQLMAEHLGPDETSVGTGFQFNHEAATPIGMKVTMRVKLLEVQGRKHVFELEGHDEVDRICTGRHERFVINKPKFLAKVAEKQKKTGV